MLLAKVTTGMAAGSDGVRWRAGIRGDGGGNVAVPLLLRYIRKFAVENGMKNRRPFSFDLLFIPRRRGTQAREARFIVLKRSVRGCPLMGDGVILRV